MDVLLISGAAGVGKSTVGWEVGRQLARANVSHAIIDSDELDRVHPPPEPTFELISLSRRNLEALWRNFKELGHNRLLLVGVMLDLRLNLAWIGEALDHPEITVVRLVASDDTLRSRIEQREIGSDKARQLARTLSQASQLRRQSIEGWIVVETDGRGPVDIAAKILDRARWLAEPRPGN